MIRSILRAAGLAIILAATGCGGNNFSSGTGARVPGLNVAEAALQGGAGQIALRVSEDVLRDAPDNAHALEVKGDALALLGDSDGATSVYQALLAKDPNAVRATIGLGRIKLGKDPAAAEALFQRVLKRDPKELTALNNLGIARDLQGKHADAQTVYRTALAINPELDSAQVNLALSMAMTGQGAAAIKLMKEKASKPGAPIKIRHDYAMVLAMAGHRSEAELILSDDLPPDQIRQMLDGTTGTRSQAAAPVNAAAPSFGAIPPDVLQVPDVATRAPRAGQAAVAALSAPPPAVARPLAVVMPEAETPVTQSPVPIVAAVANQRPSSPPTRAGEMAPSEPDTFPDPGLATPKVVSVPPARQIQPSSAVAPAEAPKATLPATPPPMLKPASTPGDQPRPVAQVSPRASVQVSRAELEAPALVAPAVPAEPTPRPAPPALTSAETPSVQPPQIQFAAAVSEESAHAVWQNLVRRFPDALSHREATVIRYERAGTVFWRVRAEGFGTIQEARTLCARIRSGGQDCFVPRS
jgi:Flp pilus assembly protein TadD